MKQVNWKAYENWYRFMKHTAFLFDDSQPVVFGDIDTRPDDEPYIHIRQECVSSWIPLRFVIESEVAE